MKNVCAFRLFLVATLLLMVPILAPDKEGGAGPGGGFEYPNSKALLKKVSSELADQIEKMNPDAFAGLPKDLGRGEIARLIREIKPRPNLYKSRVNSQGEDEGLMFDYSSSYFPDDQPCASPQKAIFALQPFYDTYRALPMKQLALEKFSSDIYKLTEKDLRQRLLHEVGHFANVGVGKLDDDNGDIFADRVLQAAESQYVRCEATQWLPTTDGTASYWEGFMLHRASGQVFVVYYSYSSTSRVLDPVTQDLVPWPKPDFNKSPDFYSKILDQMEVNALTKNWGRFPSVKAEGTVLTPQQYVLTDTNVTWTSEDSPTFGAGSSQKINLDLEKGSGTLAIPFPVYEADNTWKGKFTFLTYQLRCRSLGQVIKISDIESR